MEGQGVESDTDWAKISQGLKQVRKRRWFLWGVILIYIPAIWTSLELTHSDRATGVVFAVWLVFLCIAVGLAAFAPCPRCGNYFHMNGFIPLYFRQCLHCGLHVVADKKNKPGP